MWAMGSDKTMAPCGKPRRPLKLLLVEDHRDTAEIFARLLRSWGHSVQAAFDCASARAAAKWQRVDVLLCDRELPDGDGCKLLRELRNHGGLPHLRGLMISGYGAPADIELASAGGYEIHLLKPIDPETLFASLELLGQPSPPITRVTNPVLKKRRRQKQS
jgi:two-component system, chemotaxis family, CheB/CheR fusion protein